MFYLSPNIVAGSSRLIETIVTERSFSQKLKARSLSQKFINKCIYLQKLSGKIYFKM